MGARLLRLVPRPRLLARWIITRVLLVTVLVLAVGNLGILGVHLWAQHAVKQLPVPTIEGVPNLAAVTTDVWRGAAPTKKGVRGLAANGITTVVDLRAEHNLVHDNEFFEGLGIKLVTIPIRDGQTPSTAQVKRFLDAVDGSSGKVYVHCGAGVGRTGTMAAAYLVGSGKASPRDALLQNLAIGPPSLEQIAFAAGLDGNTPSGPNVEVVAVSRFLDAPRRFWSVVGTN